VELRRRLDVVGLDAQPGQTIGTYSRGMRQRPLLLGPSLRQSAVGRIFDAANPYSAAVNAYDLVIIDSLPIHALGPQIALALAWLALTFPFALRGFRRIGA
jgi:hypothetical protein